MADDTRGQLHKDDSLVFADETVIDSQPNPEASSPQVPQFLSYKQSFEPTQADSDNVPAPESNERSQESTFTPVRRAHSFQSSLHQRNSLDVPPKTQRTVSDSQFGSNKRRKHSSGIFATSSPRPAVIAEELRHMKLQHEQADTHVHNNGTSADMFDDTQQIGPGKDSQKFLSKDDTVPDENTQQKSNSTDSPRAAGPPNGLAVNNEADTLEINVPQELPNSSFNVYEMEMENPDTQKIHPNNTQTLYPPHLKLHLDESQGIYFDDTQKIHPNDTQAADNSQGIQFGDSRNLQFNDTQRIHPSDSQPAQQNHEFVLNDTQKIHPDDSPGIHFNFANDTQKIHNSNSSDVQKIQQPSPVGSFSKMQPDRQSQYSGDRKKEFVLSSPNVPLKIDHNIFQGDTQPITQVIWTSPEKELDTYNREQVVSSPNRTREEDYSNAESTAVMISPIFKESAAEPTTQVFNTQEDSINSDFDNSKPLDLGANSVLLSSQQRSQQSGRHLNEGELSIISNDDESPNGVFYEDSVFRHKQKQEQANDGAGNSGILSTPLESPGSDSLSALEDITNDVDNSELRLITKDWDMDPNESNVSINIPKKRKYNLVVVTQSQEEEELGAPKYISLEDLTSLDVRSMKRLDAVWAFTQFKYFPGRIVNHVSDVSSLVEFTDGIQMEIKHADMFLLDIRVGDILDTLLKKGTYVVTGLGSSYPDSLFISSRGYDTVYLSKKGKHNVPFGPSFPVSLASVYMELAHWVLHQTKFHLVCGDVDLTQQNYIAIKKVCEENVQSPSPVPKTEPESTRVSPRKLKTEKPNGIFSGMVFFVTSIEENRKNRLAKLINGNGGTLIDDEIRQYLTFDQDLKNEGRLKLSLSHFHGFKFGALLSDGHSRSAKYLQALALGWPILADTFIDEALADPTMVDQWFIFLLPAGQSYYTNSLRSHETFAFRLNWLHQKYLTEQLDINGHLLNNVEVLILEADQDKKVLEMCRFIFHAFGAKTLRSFESVEDAENFINARSIKRSYLIYDNEKEFYEAFNKAGKAKLKKDSIFEEQTEVAIVDWEWVVQSVICNHIWPPVSKMYL